MLGSAILVILICVGISYLVSYYRKQLPLIKAAKLFPGPKTQPIIGNAHFFFQTNYEVSEFLNRVTLLADTYPSPFRFWMGNSLLIFVTEPEDVKTILQSQSCLSKNVLYDPFKSWLGNGLFTAPASIWTSHRKMIASCFNTNNLRNFCDTFVEQALILSEKLENMANHEIDLFPHITMCTLDIIYATSLDIKLEAQLKKNIRHVKAFIRLKEIVLCRIRNIFFKFDIIFNLSPLKREQQEHLNYIHSAADEVIKQKENARSNVNPIDTGSTKSRKKVFLDMLMEASDEGKKFTREDIHNEINTMTVAGSDTSAITINFLLFMLGNFPEVQDKVYKELLDIYGTQDPRTAPVKFEDLQYMLYLECVIKETMRLFPVGPIIGRHLSDDLKIEKYTLPKDADIMIPVLSLHRNEKYWPNALEFNPDRFLPENMSSIYSSCYMPFSSGPRNCIGNKFAMISMKVIITTLLRTYVIKVDRKLKIEDIKLKMDILLVPCEPLMVRLEMRD